jgi:hypothetical protein
VNYFPFTGITSSFNYKINYRGIKDSITLNNDTIHIQKDSTRQGSFKVNIQPGVNLPPHFSLFCWDRSLGFYYKNNPATTVNKTMDTLEIRFTETKVDTLYNYDTVSVTITNSKGINTDSEIFKLTKTDSCFFKLFTIAIDSTPIKNDGILQVYEEDTIIATFRNKKLPLDTLRLAVPFNAVTAIQSNTIISNGRFSFILMKNGAGNYCMKYHNLPGNGKITLYTINGRTVFQRQINKGSSAISLPNTISPSVYILQVNYGGIVSKRKVLWQ